MTQPTQEREEAPHSSERSLLFAISLVLVCIVLVAVSKFMWNLGSDLINVLSVIQPGS